MKQAVRALSWAVNIFWIMLLLFTITVAYSAFEIRPIFDEPSASALNDTLVVSLPLILYVGGFYDISKFNVTTMINDNRGSIISASSTYLPIIPHGENTSITLKMQLNVTDLVTSDASNLLFYDSELNATALLRLTYANAFPFEISANFTIPWGAPLANLTIQEISLTPFNSTHMAASVPLSFENHSYFEIGGTVQLEIVDNRERVVGGGTATFDAMPESPFDTNISVLLSGNPAHIREARLHFVTPLFSYGPVVVPLV